ncbi:hypothetical protein, partial [Streptomyces albidoflavus]|uniref:hypothetical protein n=1 Tax=Streptomyces albidoflavus TaxID=1886 RepID=UPI001C3EC30A
VHGLHLVEGGLLQRQLALGADRGDLGLHGLGVPAVRVDDDQLRPVVEDQPVRGGPAAEQAQAPRRGLGRLAGPRGCSGAGGARTSGRCG